MSAKQDMGIHLLAKEYKALQKNPPPYISVGLQDDKIDCWTVMIYGPAGTLLEEGIYKALLQFPPEYPMQPPTMTFQTKMWHPNIYEDGRVCISILHTPGEDIFNEQEKAEERWRPILNAEGILISVLSMLTDENPNLDSPANVEAAKQYRENFADYKKKVRRLARESQETAFD